MTAAVCDEFERLTGVRRGVIQPAFGMAECATCVTYADDYGPGASVRLLTASLSGGAAEVCVAGADAPDESVTSFVDLGPPVPGVELRIVPPPRHRGRRRCSPRHRRSRTKIRTKNKKIKNKKEKTIFRILRRHNFRAAVNGVFCPDISSFGLKYDRPHCPNIASCSQVLTKPST